MAFSFRVVAHKRLQWIILLLGVIIVLLAVILGATAKPDAPTWHATYGPPILYSVGASVIAAAILAFLNPISFTAYQRLLSLGVESVWPSRRDIEASQWVKWLRQADRKCVLFGITHNEWCRDPDFEGAISGRLTSGVDVRVFFLDPNSSASDVRAKEDKGSGRETKPTIRSSIGVLWRIRENLREDVRARLTLYVYDATPSLGLTWIDEFMIITHYLAGSINRTSPAMRIEPGRQDSDHQDLYRTYAKNVQRIENEFATKLDETNIREYLPDDVAV